MKTKPWKELSPEEQAERLAEAGEPEEEFSPQQIVYDEASGDVGYRLFLAGLDSDTRALITDAELRNIYEAQLKAALEEKRAAKRKSAHGLALQAARMSAGLVPRAAAEAMALHKYNNETVRHTIQLPPSGENGEVADVGLRIDQKIYVHGATYTMTRAQLASVLEMEYRAAEHELLFEGKKIRQRRWHLSRAQGGVNTHIDLNPDGSLA